MQLNIRNRLCYSLSMHVFKLKKVNYKITDSNHTYCTLIDYTELSKVCSVFL